MGSLVSGWSSHALDDRKDIVRSRRNSSLTNEEIDAFWKLQKKSELEEFELEEDSKSPKKSHLVRDISVIKKSASLRAQSEPSSPLASKEVDEISKLYKTGDWWTRSSWAFLNEPPPADETADSAHKYAVQLDV
ncbi:uncharacterized protein [Typha angustifolia]|uniref:uncharacterized protein n=1 Tax=Typha angustifolia TaxID=59011 RepID=UPI003C2C195C